MAMRNDRSVAFWSAGVAMTRERCETATGTQEVAHAWSCKAGKVTDSPTSRCYLSLIRYLGILLMLRLMFDVFTLLQG
jgi:hypothetical protein